MTFRWEIENDIHDEQGVPVLGVCDCDPEEMPDTIMLSANGGMVRGALRSCCGASWPTSLVTAFATPQAGLLPIAT